MTISIDFDDLPYIYPIEPGADDLNIAEYARYLEKRIIDLESRTPGHSATDIPFVGNEPTRAHDDDAGFDLICTIDFELNEGKRALVPTGTAVSIPSGHVGLVCPRSGLASRFGITVLNAPGVIDSGYTGEIKVNLVNLGPYDVSLSRNTRIAQLLIIPLAANVTLTRVDALEDTERGANGHGSTGL